MKADEEFLFGVTTYSYTRSMEARTCLLHLKGLGFRRFDLVIQPGHAWPDDLSAEERADLRQFLAGEGLTVDTLNLPNADLNLTSVLPEAREVTIALLSSVLELAGDLGVRKIIVGPGKPNALFPAPREQLLNWLYAGLEILCARASDAGTGILLENMPFSFLPDSEGLVRAVDMFGNPDIGLIYDVANGTFIGEDVAGGIAAMAERLYTVHCSDTGLRHFRHDPVGEGVVDFPRASDALDGIHLVCPPLLEIITMQPDAGILQSAMRLREIGFAM